MKRIASILMAVMLICSAFTFNATAAEINNVLGDQGDPANFPMTTDQSRIGVWWWWAQKNTLTNELVDGVKPDGSQGKLYRFNHSADVGSTFMRIQLTPDKFEPETEYVASVMAKPNDEVRYAGNNQGFYFHINGNGVAKTSKSIGFNERGTWNNVRVYFTTPKAEELTGNFKMEVWLGATEGMCLATDFIICKASELPEPEPEPAPSSSEKPEDPEEDKPTISIKPPSNPNIVTSDSGNSDAAPSNGGDAEDETAFPWIWVGIGGGIVLLAGAAVAVYFLVIKKK